VTHTLVVATQNRGKLDELRALLAPLGLEVLSPQDVSKKEIVVIEDGETFDANAKKKAQTVAGLTMMLTVADDSGLEVDVLGGAPGVRSARFAGERATDAENNAALLGRRAAPGASAMTPSSSSKAPTRPWPSSPKKRRTASRTAHARSASCGSSSRRFSPSATRSRARSATSYFPNTSKCTPTPRLRKT
jgi:hypothetical protein